MPAFADVTLKNFAQANVVFKSQSINGEGVARWQTDDAVFDAKKVLTQQLTLPKNGSTVVRCKQKVVIPVMNTVDTSKKDAEVIVNIEYVWPKSCTSTHRLDSREFAVTLAQNTITAQAAEFLLGVS